MGDQQEPTARMGSQQFFEQSDHPLRKLAERFSALECRLGVACLEHSPGVRLQDRRFFAGHSLQHAQMAFAQARIWNNRLLGMTDYRACSLQRPFEIARQDGIEGFAAKTPTNCRGLRPTGCAQRNVEVALNSAFGVPCCFAMTHQR